MYVCACVLENQIIVETRNVDYLLLDYIVFLLFFNPPDTLTDIVILPLSPSLFIFLTVPLTSMLSHSFPKVVFRVPTPPQWGYWIWAEVRLRSPSAQRMRYGGKEAE